jgi:hypothetical protein
MPIPSRSIIDHPRATEVREEDLAAFLARFRVDESRAAGRGIRR